MSKGCQLDYDSCNISSAIIHEWYSQLAHEVIRIGALVKEELCKTPYAFLRLPYDNQLFDSVVSVAQRVQSYNPSLCIVVGIGGSSLGTRAVYEAFGGMRYNNPLNSTRLCFVETVDSDCVEAVKQQMLHEAEQGGSIVLNVISKSGRTTETIVNFELLFLVLKECHPNDYNNRVVVTTDHDSPLAECATNYNFSTLYIPKLVGGRYSVFSAVGLFPLALAGINVEELRFGAQQACEDGLRDNYKTNKAAINACITYAHYQAGIIINDMFLFSPVLQSVGLWWRQLMGESLGKQTISGDKRVGILPTVSIGSIDLHSVAQLYLGGSVQLLTNFVAFANTGHEITVPDSYLCGKLVSNIGGKTVSSIMDAILQGTLQAYKKNGNPFTVTTLYNKKEYDLGYFLQAKMLEVIYLGFLLNVNPFDQPDVERYKRITREILAHG